MRSVLAPTVGVMSHFIWGFTTRESSQYHIALGAVGVGSAAESLVVLVNVNVATPDALVRAVMSPENVVPPAATAFKVTNAFTIGVPELFVTV